MMITVPPGWTAASYRRHNDAMAAKYGEPSQDFERAIEQARRHLRMAERRRSADATCTDLRAAVESLTEALIGLAGRQA